MRIAVIGAGNVGLGIGTGWRKAGHDVVFGVRDPSNAQGEGAYATVAEAAAGAEIVVLTVMWHSVESALADCGDLTGKILIDPTNPLAMGADGLELTMGFDTSSAEWIAARTAARVVKALNQVGAGIMADASGYSVRPVQFVAGDDADAKAIVRKLVEELGFETLDAGPLRNARLLEPLGMVWIDQSMKRGMAPNRAWALVRRDG